MRLGVSAYQVQFAELILPKAAELVFPGVADGLAALRDQGFLLAVATSKFYRSADALLTAAGLRDQFDLVIGADQVTNPKPHPEMGELILSKLGVDPAHAIMVGDTTHDLQMAAAAGLRSVAVTYGVHSEAELGSASPTWLAGSFDEVVRCLTAGRHRGLVEELLDDDTYHIEFNGHLTNHAKHAVVALARLGAPAQRIRSYYDGYAALTPYGYGLEAPKASKHEISQTSWRRYLGQRSSFSSYCQFFDWREKELGTDELLRTYAPELLPGWVGAFTHAAIHLGWALDAGSRWMMVEGLAYLAFSSVSCHPERACPAATSPGAPGSGGAVDALLAVARAWESDEGGLASHIDALIEDHGAGLAAGIHPELARSGLQYRQARVLDAGHEAIYQIPAFIGQADTNAAWEELYYAATLLYLSVPGDFVLLHLITALHGVEQIAARLPDDQRRNALTCFWIGMICILLAERNVPAPERLAALHATYQDEVDTVGSPLADQDWEQLVARAIEEDEEHNPKLVYVLRQVWQRTGRRTIYRAAAAAFTTTPELPKSFELPPTE